ncbi:MAG: sigma-70 family RNA polymerase sigma factor [Fimbriimonadaceae bacterium]|nr:sigma-70 family RNA polymerase sigma factor [Fimbriimonadaceae bacterium]QYK54835.1 MAG: sigma-70 family RNA polymerase sigma factor [Fimbriimonadaceae bacterium]
MVLDISSWDWVNIAYHEGVGKIHLEDRIPVWEEHLVRRAQAGESVALEMLLDQYRPAVRAQAMRMLRDADDASDAVQETFVKAVRALGTFDPERPLLPWLMRICSNCCVDLMRDRRKVGESLEPHEHSLTDDGVDIQRGAERDHERAIVEGAVTRLPERYRDIIVMRHYRHMDVNEIATALDKPEGTIKSWLFRARALLRKDLDVACLG